jgi:hypothetical protein
VSAASRRGAAVLDALPVALLAAIAGAGSFTHIRDTAAEHGQRGPMSWAVAVCIDLTCVMAARERQRDKRHGITTGRLSWPTVALAAGVLLSLAANLAQAQPSVWGQVMAATPSAAFLVPVSMLERRASARRHGSQQAPEPGAPVLRAVPDQDEVLSASSWAGRPSRTYPDAALLASARRAAAEHQATHGQPITRDALRARLGVSNQLASDLLRQVRVPEPG